MRKLPLLFLPLFSAGLCAEAHAQSAAVATTHPRIGLYITMDNNLGSIRSAAGYIAGSEVGVILSRRFSIGLAGYGLTTKEAMVPGPSGASAMDTLRLGYGGIRAGYLGKPEGPYHPMVDFMFGGGEIRAKGSGPSRKDRVLVAESAVMMEADLSRFMRGALGVSYRAVLGSDLAGVSDGSLSGVTGRLTLRFGRF